ncbi:MAG: alpha/beta hydrolase [Nocardioidaceae bacterium]
MTLDSALTRGVAALAAVFMVASCSAAQDVANGDDTTSPTPATETSASPTSPTSPSTSEPVDGLPKGFGDGPAGKGVDRFYQQDVSWTACDGGECADIWVPLDYNEPDGQAITLKAKRQPAGDESKRRGSLLINPGGPGGSGIDYLGFIGLDSSITDVYDVVGFDPRGVGQSTPVDCLPDSQLETYVASDPTPDDASEISDFQGIWSNFTVGCVDNSGPLLKHVSTIEVARDMDIIRAVVGDPKLNYFGASYGTYIGATYAALFAKNVDRMVLDGAVDPLSTPHESEVNQAAGFDTAFTAYLKDCVSQGDCPLGDSVDSARARLIQLFKDIDASPLPTSSGREVTEGLAFLGVIVPLYSRTNWGILTTAMSEAVQGSGDTLLLAADAYTERQPDGSYASNSLEVQPAVNCLDHPEHESLQQIEQGGPAFRAKAPVFGQAAMWWPFTCSNWPVRPSAPQPDYSAKGAAPIVVVGTTRDPATPYEQAVRLAKELDSGVLLSRDGDGHTAYGAGNSCIDRAINTYLAQGTPPKDGTTC